MRIRQLVIRDQARVMKVKAWKRLLAIAMDKEINSNTIAALEAVISIAEPVDEGEVSNGLCNN